MDEEEMDKSILEVARLRDEKRPEMQRVVEVLDRVFERFSATADFRKVQRGPNQWSWLDATNSARGFDRWFILSESAMPGAEGYPLLTIRQATAPRLDAWLTVSQLILGPTDHEIESSFAMLMANHHGAFDGFRGMISDMVDLVNTVGAAGKNKEMN